MPWSKNDYPDAMKNLDEKTRNKAIEIANELLKDDYNEGRAISIAISRAKEWAKDHTRSNSSSSSSSNKKGNSSNSSSKGDKDQHLVPHGDKWAIKKEKSDQASYTFETKKEALDKAKEMAKNQSVNIVIHRKDGTIEDTITP